MVLTGQELRCKTTSDTAKWGEKVSTRKGAGVGSGHTSNSGPWYA